MLDPFVADWKEVMWSFGGAGHGLTWLLHPLGMAIQVFTPNTNLSPPPGVTSWPG